MNSRPRLRSWLVVFVWLCAPQTASAQVQSGPSPPDPLPVYTREADGRVTIRATRIGQPPRIDGRLDDAVYQEVPAFSGFIQADPVEGQPET